MSKDPPTPDTTAVTADSKPTEVKSDTATRAAPLTRVEYTGQTPGTISDLDGRVLVRHVEPGDVLEPETARERKALLDTGHFQLTRRRATTDGMPTTTAPQPDAAQETE